MDVTVRVDVATRRPPGEHDFVCVTVSVDLPPDDGTIAGLNRAMRSAEIEAEVVACQMAFVRPNVVMPVRATVIAVNNI